LVHTNQQNQELSKKMDRTLKQNEALTQQLQHLTKLLYGSKTEQSKYNAPDGQGSLFDEDDPSFTDSEHTEEQSQQTISYTVVRKYRRKREMIHCVMM
jgi:transposase